MMSNIIIKKRNKEELSDEEIGFFVNEYVKETIPDYQMSALLMAIFLNGMNEHETATLTKAMMHSGEVIDLSKINGIKVDKHSTGGVGDKTTLVLAPLVAACGVKVAKMSGRGLGHTGGTLDKMESIPHLRVQLSMAEFIEQVNRIGVAIIGQTSNLVPADKKIYALRDVTGTVDSIPLIAASIMSKKLATGSDCILLDVKYGSGAFFEDPKQATKLAQAMTAIGKNMQKDTRAILTNMNQPLGKAIGNALEIKEVIATLQGNGPQDLVELCLEAGAIMLLQAKVVTNHQQALALLSSKLKDGTAMQKLIDLVSWQGGDTRYILDPSHFKLAKHIKAIKAKNEGYVAAIDAHRLGEIAMLLGAGRKEKDDIIDYAAGIVVEKKQQDYVAKGDVLAWIHTNHVDFNTYVEAVEKTFYLQSVQPKKEALIYAVID